MLEPGDLAPWFTAQELDGRPNWVFNSAGGVPSLLFFMGSASQPAVAEALAQIVQHVDFFHDARALFFGITADPADAGEGRIRAQYPAQRYFLDYSLAIARQYGAADAEGMYRPHLIVLDRALRVAGRFAIGDVGAAIALTVELTKAPGQDWAPIVTVPHVFEPGLCRALIDHYDRVGGTESGFMREVAGKTTEILDPAFKRRRDAQIEDQTLRTAIIARVKRKLVPAVHRTFQFNATRIERYIVAAYDAGAGHFSAHRDNTTKGTAHRRFAVTINLNSDYEGGDLRFPEFGQRSYRAPPGGAVVFSCSLLHEATPVTAGRRYACLPFLYDDEAAAIREANNEYLADGMGHYRG
jgi:predicted 2-oxoglutarate/Fe(II)-dependent dioxygenase YbiX/peroxiredoxin